MFEIKKQDTVPLNLEKLRVMHIEPMSPETAAIIEEWAKTPGSLTPAEKAEFQERHKGSIVLTEELPDVVGNSNPFMNLAKFYRLDYGDVLLYADSMKTNRTYTNPEHEAYAIDRVSWHFTGSQVCLSYFEHHVRLILKRINQD